MTSAEEIKAAYLNPEAPGSLGGIKTFLYHNPQFKDPKFVKTVLEDLRTYTRHRGQRHEKRRRLEVSFLNEITAFDTLDLLSLKYSNSHFGYILVLVNCFSRKVFLYPMKTKGATCVSKALTEHFSTPENFTYKLFGDRDKAYTSNTTQAVLKRFGIELYHSSSKLKAFLAEVYVKIVKGRIFRALTHTKKKRWLDLLPEIAKSINENVNPSTGFKPNEVSEDNSDQVWHNLYNDAILAKPSRPEFRVGQLVRLASEKTVFTKRYTATFSEEIFKIRQIRPTRPVTYTLEDLSGTKIRGSVYGFELSRVSSAQPKD